MVIEDGEVCLVVRYGMAQVNVYHGSILVEVAVLRFDHDVGGVVITKLYGSYALCCDIRSIIRLLKGNGKILSHNFEIRRRHCNLFMSFG